MFYHTMLALSPVARGCAPFFAATGSFARARAATEAMSPEEQDEVRRRSVPPPPARPPHLHALVTAHPAQEGSAGGAGETAARGAPLSHRRQQVVPGADETRTQLPGYLREAVADWREVEIPKAGHELSDLPARPARTSAAHPARTTMRLEFSAPHPRNTLAVSS
jgi:hypothetical protein